MKNLTPYKASKKEVPITALGTTTEAHPHALMRGAPITLLAVPLKGAQDSYS
nr:hypothetical protein [Corynebacterium diphtheriae]